MVEKFKQIANKIISEKGSIVFFGIFKMDEITDKWSVIFSALWATDDKKDETFAYLIDLIKLNLSVDESASIARVNIFAVNDHRTDLFLNYQAGSRIQEQAVNGNVIYDGFVLASNRPNLI